MSALTIYHGIPGSGKSTLAAARKLTLEAAGHRVEIVNRDTLRTEVAGEEYHSGTPNGAVEKRVTALQEERIRAALASGAQVISDDTNLKPAVVNFLRSLATEAGVPVQHFFVDVPVKVALQRNRARGKAGGREVPFFVINGMAKSAYKEDGTGVSEENLVLPGELVTRV